MFFSLSCNLTSFVIKLLKSTVSLLQILSFRIFLNLIIHSLARFLISSRFAEKPWIFRFRTCIENLTFHYGIPKLIRDVKKKKKNNTDLYDMCQYKCITYIHIYTFYTKIAQKFFYRGFRNRRSEFRLRLRVL